MGLCPSRAAHAAQQVQRWERIVKHMKRLMFLQRLWSAMGHSLKMVKKRGREVQGGNVEGIDEEE